jgi:hypothetical protein
MMMSKKCNTIEDYYIFISPGEDICPNCGGHYYLIRKKDIIIISCNCNTDFAEYSADKPLNKEWHKCSYDEKPFWEGSVMLRMEIVAAG